MQKEEKLPYRLHKVAAGWLVQNKISAVKYETLAFCATLQEATDYLFAWKEINS